MNADQLAYLRPDVMAEPLSGSWPVTLPMLAPHTSAMLVRNRQIPLLQSYLKSPKSHLEAAADPALRGGPFVQLAEACVPEVRALLQQTLIEDRALIEFADALARFDAILQSAADGSSLEPLYRRLPRPLRGLVELVYDLHSRPALRFIEALLYRSQLFDVSRQSMLLSRVETDDRSFVLSTPRLESEHGLRVKVPFADEAHDLLFGSRRNGVRFGELSEALGLGAEDRRLLAGMLSEEPGVRHAPYEGAGVRVRYFGHAALLFESAGTSIMTDPLVAYHRAGGGRRFSYSDIPDVLDYVLITHAHLDHLVLETLLQLRSRIDTIVLPRGSRGSLAEPSVKMLLRQIGFRCEIVELDCLEQIDCPAGRITALPFLGEHHDLDIQGKTTYRLDLRGRSFLIAVDSANLDPEVFVRVREATGSVNTAFVGMECDGAPPTWFYGHLLMRELEREKANSRQGSASDAAQATAMIKALGVEEAYVYAMGLEPWFGHILALNVDESSKQMKESNAFLAACRESAIKAELLFGIREWAYERERGGSTVLQAAAGG